MIYNIRNLPAREIMPGWFGKVLHSQKMTFILWEVSKGVILPKHLHPHEQVVHMISGNFEFIVGGHKQTLKNNEICIVPPNIFHEGVALTDCQILDTFCPVREDYVV